MFEIRADIPYQHIAFDHGIVVSVKRIDLVHPHIAGNKFYKLKYNLQAAREQGKTLLISFQALGIIRGQELAEQPLNPTLQDAAALGMQLQFISRADYRQKHTPEFLQAVLQRYPHAYVIPEGGCNDLAIQGCAEILSEADKRDFEVICCAVGTGGTLAGLINASASQQRLIGYAALKTDHLSAEIMHMTHKRQWQVFSEEVFGGYGRFNAELLDFIANTQARAGLPLDPIYTGKAFYRLSQQIHAGDFAPHSRILFIHTGGLQGHRPANRAHSA